MPGFGTAFSRGLILGAGAALLYAAARETIAPARHTASADDDTSSNQRALADPDRLIDWELATRVAVRAAGRAPSLHPGARAQIQASYEAILRDIEAPIAAYVGNDLSLANTAVEVLDRHGLDPRQHVQLPLPAAAGRGFL